MRRVERPGGGRWQGVLVSRRRTLWQGTRTMVMHVDGVHLQPDKRRLMEIEVPTVSWWRWQVRFRMHVWQNTGVSESLRACILPPSKKDVILKLGQIIKEVK
jgi:hypothetical protein